MSPPPKIEWPIESPAPLHSDADPLAQARLLLDGVLVDLVPIWESNDAIVQAVGSLGFASIVAFVEAFKSSAPFQEIVKEVQEAIDQKALQSPMAVEDEDEPIPETDPDQDRARIKANFDAIKTMERIEAKRAQDLSYQATPEELKRLDRYTGWGGLSGALKTINLAQIGIPKTISDKSIEAGFDEYYTPSALTKVIGGALAPAIKSLRKKRARFVEVEEDQVRIKALEPSAGIGRFVRDVSAKLPFSMDWTLVELSPLSSRMLEAIYSPGTVFNGFFEQWTAQYDGASPPTPVPSFDIVVSNPPYMEPRGSSQKMDLSLISQQENKASNYFLRRCLEQLLPGGLGCFLIPSGFMSSSTKAASLLRQRVLRDCYLVDAYRMPSNIFAGATIVTDLLFFESYGTIVEGNLVKARINGYDDGESKQKAASKKKLLQEVKAEQERMTTIIDGRWFEKHPEKVLGREFIGSKSYQVEVTGKTREERGKVKDEIIAKIEAQGRKVSRRVVDYYVKGTAKRFKEIKPKFSKIPKVFTFEKRPYPAKATKRSIFVGLDVSTTNLPKIVADAANLGGRVNEFLKFYAIKSSKSRQLWPRLRKDLEGWRIAANPENDANLERYGVRLEAFLRGKEKSKPKKPKVILANPHKVEEILQARHGLYGFHIESFLEAFDEKGQVRDYDFDFVEIKADDLAPDPSDVVSQAWRLFNQRLSLNISELLAYHRSIGGTFTKTKLGNELIGAGWGVFGEDFDQYEPSRLPTQESDPSKPGFVPDYFLTGYLWQKIDDSEKFKDQGGKLGAIATAQLAKLYSAIGYANYTDGKGFDATLADRWIPIEIIQEFINQEIQPSYYPLEFSRDDYGNVTMWDAPNSSRVQATKANPYTDKQLTKMDLVPPHLTQGRSRISSVRGDVRDILGYLNEDMNLFRPPAPKELVPKVDENGNKLYKKDEYGRQVPIMEKKTPDIWVVRDRKAAQWNEAFRAWLSNQNGEEGNPDYIGPVEDAYNRLYRGFIERRFSQAPLDLARWRSKDQGGIDLKGHQNEGVRQMAAGHGGLLAFDVGVGKTYTSICTIVLGIQEGWITKPLIVVPNTLIWKWYEDVRKVAPSLRVLVVGSDRKVVRSGPNKGKVKADIEGQGLGKGAGARIRGAKWRAYQRGEYDVAIITYSMLGRTAINRDELVKYVETTPQIKAEFESDVEKAKEDIKKANEIESKGKKISKTLAEAVQRGTMILEEGIKGFIDTRLSIGADIELDKGILFDDIGIDFIAIDEAQNFKNLYKPKPRGRSGVPKFMGSAGRGSDRAWSLEFRSAIIRQTHRRLHGHAGGVLLLSATPAKNSPLELYNLIQYINHNAFSSLQLWSSEQFINRFCEIKAKTTINTSTQRPETKQTLVGFRNVGELRTILKKYGIFRSAADLPELAASLPKQGEPILEEIAMNFSQESAYAWARERVEKELRDAKEERRPAQVLGLLSVMSQVSLHPFLSWLKSAPVVATSEDGEVLYDELTGQPVLLRGKSMSAKARWDFANREKPWGYEEDLPYENMERPALDEWGDVIEGQFVTGKPYFPRETWSSPKLLTCAFNIGQTRLMTGCNADGQEQCGPTTCGHIVFVENIGVHVWLFKLLTRGFHYVFQERAQYDMDPDSETAGEPTGVMLPAGVRAPRPDDPKDKIHWFTPYPAERIGILNSIKAKSPEQRLQIAKDFNGSDESPPKLDIVIANQVAYEGIDLQRQTCQIHHLDLPWEPATYQQRNGRGVRQGNLQDRIYIRNYFSSRSFDGIRFQLLSGKAGWMNSILKMPVGEAAEAKVINNPAASGEFDDPGFLAMLIARTPKEGIELAKKYREEVFKAKREEVIARAQSLVRRAESAFIKARTNPDPIKRESFKSEGIGLIRILEDIDQDPNYGWPYAEETKAALLRGPVMLDRRARPVYPGQVISLTLGKTKGIMAVGKITVTSRGRFLGGRYVGSSLKKAIEDESWPFGALPEFKVNESLVEDALDDNWDDLDKARELFEEAGDALQINLEGWSSEQFSQRLALFLKFLRSDDGFIKSVWSHNDSLSFALKIASIRDNDPLKLGEERELFYVPAIIDGVLVGLHGKAVLEHAGAIIPPLSSEYSTFLDAFIAQGKIKKEWIGIEFGKEGAGNTLLPYSPKERQVGGQPCPYTACLLMSRAWFGRHLQTAWRKSPEKAAEDAKAAAVLQANPALLIGNPSLIVGNPPGDCAPCAGRRAPGRRINPGRLQSILIYRSAQVKSRRSALNAARKIKKGLKSRIWEETSSGWRFRQEDPRKFDPESFRTKVLKSRGGAPKAALIYASLKARNPRFNQPGRFDIEEIEEREKDSSWQPAYDMTVARYGEWGDPDHMVELETAPGTSKFVTPIGELAQIEYYAADNGERKLIRYYHPAGDHGKGKRKTKSPILIYDAKNKWIGFGKPKGSKFDFTDRGIVG